jgi:hypothetical protein
LASAVANPTYPHEGENLETIDLEIIKRRAQSAISKELLRDVIVDVAEQPFLDQIVVQATVHLLALKAKEEQTTESEKVAVGWWDHLILSFTARFVDLDADWDGREGFWWALRRRANTRSVITRSTIYYACPHIEVPMDRGRHIRWLQSVDDSKDV